jgi:putative SOS response-associated peptidase YedK
VKRPRGSFPRKGKEARPQPVVLRPAQALDWLKLARTEAALFATLPAGSLSVVKATRT